MTANQYDKKNNNSDSFFNSVDFQKFLKENTNALIEKTNSDIFKSKDSFTENLFKSRESFSNLFNSMDSNNSSSIKDGMKLPSSSEGGGDDDYFRSKEWKNLGSHVDVRYSPEQLFCDAGIARPDGTFSSTDFQKVVEAPTEDADDPSKTNWGDFFFSQLHPPAEPATFAFSSTSPTTTTASTTPPPPSTTTTAPTTATTPPTMIGPTGATAPVTRARIPTVATATAAATVPTVPTKRRPRKAANSTNNNNSSKKKDDGRQYILHPTEVDILLGRGGKSNHHPGNKRYREEIKNFQASYMKLTNKDEKTDLSRYVVDYVHDYKGRFLAMDKTVRPNRWYEIPDVMARRKVSQALREDDDPVKRREKRERYLDRKSKKQQQQQQQASKQQQQQQQHYQV
eukprot:scaffold1311_cov99-Cylindrotheca_fusiformis.AAC.9